MKYKKCPIRKVVEIYYEDLSEIRRKNHPYENGLIFVLEDGTRLRQNCCENQCLVAFNEEAVTPIQGK